MIPVFYFIIIVAHLRAQMRSTGKSRFYKHIVPNGTRGRCQIANGALPFRNTVKPIFTFSYYHIIKLLIDSFQRENKSKLSCLILQCLKAAGSAAMTGFHVGVQ